MPIPVMSTVKKPTDVDSPEWRKRVGDYRVFLTPEMKRKELRVTRVRKREQVY